MQASCRERRKGKFRQESRRSQENTRGGKTTTKDHTRAQLSLLRLEGTRARRRPRAAVCVRVCADVSLGAAAMLLRTALALAALLILIAPDLAHANNLRDLAAKKKKPAKAPTPKKTPREPGTHKPTPQPTMPVPNIILALAECVASLAHARPAEARGANAHAQRHGLVRHWLEQPQGELAHHGGHDEAGRAAHSPLRLAVLRPVRVFPEMQ